MQPQNESPFVVRLVRRFAILGAAASLIAMSGCLVSGSSSEEVSGTYIGPETYAQVQPGVTKKDWITATMGKPTCQSKLDDGTEMWKWTYHRQRKGSGSVLFLVSGSSRSETTANTFVQFKDDVVVKAWQD